jgi:predicted GIY-YIG superfamily endonuclease
MYTTYIIQSTITGTYYRGFTELKAEERLAYHNKGTVPATKDQRPWKLMWYGVFESRACALAFEKYLKSGSGHGFTWKRLIDRSVR